VALAKLSWAKAHSVFEIRYRCLKATAILPITFLDSENERSSIHPHRDSRPTWLDRVQVSQDYLRDFRFCEDVERGERWCDREYSVKEKSRKGRFGARALREVRCVGAAEPGEEGWGGILLFG
jgi:hypothetical protein